MKFIFINIDMGFHRTKTYMGVLDSTHRLCEEYMKEFKIACKLDKNKVIAGKEVIEKYKRLSFLYYVLAFNIKDHAGDYILRHYGFNSHYGGWKIVWAGYDCPDNDVLFSVGVKNETVTIK